MKLSAFLWSYDHMRKIARGFVLLLCGTFAAAQTQSAADKQLVSEAKRVAVSTLDPALPPISFEQWLRTEAGDGAKFAWESNDCGEQTGAPGRGPAEIPTCVEADARLNDGREIVIMIAVSPTRSTHKTRARQQFAVFFAQLITTREKITLKQLSDLPAALVRTHEAHHYPEIAK